ncbi:MAG: outer membrane lipoprotein LolB [Burkholderiaceae bacterium]|nr:MAG: outer membrane lipoprotein LolB [Burkholderiaceae bacterium]
MRPLPGWARAWSILLLLLALAGCAQPPRARASHTEWSGRLALQIEGQASQSFSAAFELQGTPEAGELTLYTPLGSAFARLQWAHGQARLEQGSEVHESTSLDELVRQLTGNPLPIAALFDWLEGRPAAATGWRADLSLASEGRITAERFEPPPQATLRIALNR